MPADNFVKLPKDIMFNLYKKYPDIDREKLSFIVDDIFTAIKDRVFDYGSCTVMLFGTFYCYKTLSSKRDGKPAVRFKFTISKAFNESIIHDEYLLNKIEKNIFHNINTDKIKKEWEAKRDENKYARNMFFNNRRKADERGYEAIMPTIIKDMVDQSNESSSTESERDQ